KANVAKLTCNWHGFGSGVGGNRAKLTEWYAGAYKAWETTPTIHTSGVVSKLVRPINISNGIDDNGYIHLLAYAEPSDGATPSVINTDYVELEIELKPDADFTNPRVPLYEVTDESYNKILVDWDADEVLRRYPVVEGVQHTQGFGIVAEGDNLLPPFTDSRWAINANARIVSPYELELNATSTSQKSEIFINI